MFGRFYFSIVLALFCLTSASAQNLPAETHPSLLFSPEDIPLFKERITRAPYDTWWQTVLTRSQNGLAAEAPERSKARLAKSMAFTYLMTDDETWAEQALALMQDTQFPPRGGDMGQPHNEGEIVAHYALAYDMLHSYAAANNPTALAAVREILAEEAARLEKGIVIQEIDLGLISLKIRLHETPHLDNWHVRAYGGLGLAALALSEHEDAQDWADRAFDLVTRSLDYQIEEVDGGYAEGPFYSRYSADVYLPYMFALKRRQGIDLFAGEKLKAMHLWSLNLRMPDGRRPNIDDGHVDDFYGHYLASVADNGGEYRWDWENNASGLYVRQFSEMDAIVLFDDRIAATEPTREPTVFMPGAGDAVFRSNWSATGTYMLLRGENDVARSNGLSHEHPDETSFVLHAGGEMLALDAGYIDFTNHAKVNQGRNHNVVLVDGQGPPLFTTLGLFSGGGNDAFIEDSFISGNGDYTEVRAAYQGVDFRRRVFFVDKQYFLIADQMSASAEHDYEWRLHGNGGGSSGGSYSRDGNLARWTRDSAELIAYMPESEGRSFAEVDTIHSLAAGQELTHTTLLAQQRSRNGRYLAALFPHAIDSDPPSFATLAAEGGEALSIELDGAFDIAWAKDADAESIALTSYLSDGAFGWIRTDEPEVLSYLVQDGTFLNNALPAAEQTTEMVFSASEAVDLSLRTSPEHIVGFVRGPGTGYELTLPIGNRTLSSLAFGGEVLSSSETDGFLTLGLAGSGELDLALVVLEQAPSMQLHVQARLGIRNALSPLRTRVGRDISFEVFSFSEADSSDLTPLNADYAWEVPAALGTTPALGELELTTVSGVSEDIIFSALGAETSFTIISTPHSIRQVVIEPATAQVEPNGRQTFRAMALDRYDNTVLGRNFGWHVVGDIGTINSRTGDFTAGDAPGEGYVIAVVNTSLIFADAGASVQGSGKITVGQTRPQRYVLYANAPNPFNPSTLIRFDLPLAGSVQLIIYNALGQEVERLIEKFLPAGAHSIEWNANGRPSGIYYYALETELWRDQKKMMLVR